MLSWGSGLFPQLHLNELNFWGSFQPLLEWLEKRASYASGQLKHLELIYLFRLPTLTDKHVHRLLKLCPNLRGLSLSGNEENLTVAVLDVVRELRPTKLQALSLPSLRASHFKVVCTLRACPALTRLELPFHAPVTSAILTSEGLQCLRIFGQLHDDLADVIASGRLTRLEELQVSACPSWVIALAARKCPLKIIGIPVDPPCTPQELVDIIQAAGERLECLHVPRVEPFGDDLGRLLAAHCPNLRQLEAKSENLLTNFGVSELLRSSSLNTLTIAFMENSRSCKPCRELPVPASPLRLEVSSCEMQSVSESPMAHWLNGNLLALKLERLPNYTPSEDSSLKLCCMQ